MKINLINVFIILVNHKFTFLIVSIKYIQNLLKKTKINLINKKKNKNL